jgi:predicted phage terminase large subunit-like protein
LFDSQIASRLDNPKKGGIAIIAHRLSEADLTGHVMKEGGWRRLALPLRAHRKKNYELRDGTVWHRRKGELLRPKAFSRQELARIEHMPNYQALYQQRPGGDMNLRIRPEHIGRFTDAPHRPTTVLSIDAAQKGGATHSFSVVQAWASVGEKFLLLDQWRDRTSFANFLAEVRRFIRIFRPSVVLIEDAARGPMLAEALRPCEGMLVKLVTPVQSKVDRFRRHRSFVRQGRIQIPAGAVWGRTFSQEITLFPDFETDDQVDALSQFLDYARNNPWPPARRPMAVVALGQPGQISGCSQPSMQTTRGLIAVAPRSSFKRRW